ncbi:MAG: diguanylate cyclase [Acetobacterium sp.]|uniref:sensor domain-containing diguanylate cyclase n=1 Tax=Acetobacterium sp. TaxID=1872094 RepID=UPI003242DF46
MVNVEIRELIKYLKNIVADEKPENDVLEKYGKDPDFVELDGMVRGIRSACKKHFEMIFDLFPDPTIITTMEDGKLFAYNRAFLKMIRTRGKTIIDESFNIHDLYFELDKRDQLIAELKRTGVSENMEIMVNDENNEMFVGLVSAQAINIDGEPHILSVIRDITQIKRLEEEIAKLSIMDKLTQVFNRPKLDDFLQCELERSERTKATFAIILVDVDSLRSINESYGNPVGDDLLVAVAAMLQNNVRVTDIVGRWSGEEFLIILPDTDEKGAVTLAEKIKTIVENTNFKIVGKLTASFGVSAYRKDLLPATLISRALAARNRAKEKGQNRVECQ